MACRLIACAPGSALGTTLINEYGKPLPFLLLLILQKHLFVVIFLVCVVYFVFN